MASLGSSTSRLPKYVQLADSLREQIVRGELRPQDRVPSFPQLRGEFGISQNTVEKAHALLEQEGLIVRKQGVGTFVAARERRSATNVIGIYGLDPQARRVSYYLHLLHGIQRAAHEVGLEVLLLNPRSPSTRWEKIDGVLMCHPDPERAAQSLPPGMRCVSLLYKAPGIPSVISDDYQGMFEATQHLISLGHQRIAYLHEYDPLTSPRVDGYRDALKQAGIKSQKKWQREMVPYSGEEGFRSRGRESMKQWLTDGWAEAGVTALLCQNDQTSIGVLDALREAKVRVPQQLSLIGFDSTDECEVCHPRLTSVKVPLEEIGARGLQLLLEEMERDKRKVQTTVLPTHLEVRDSTSALKTKL